MHYFTWSNAAEQFQDKKKERFLVVKKDIRRLTGAQVPARSVWLQIAVSLKERKKKTKHYFTF